MRSVLLVYIRAHETRIHSLLNKLRYILLLGLKRMALKSIVLLWVVFFEVIHQLRHFSYIFLLGRYPLRELTQDTAEIFRLHRGAHFLLHMLHIRTQHLLYQLIFGREIDIERLLGHTEFTTDIVDGNRTDSEAKKELAGRLNNMTFLVN